MISFYDWKNGKYRHPKYIEIIKTKGRMFAIIDKKEKYIFPFFGYLALIRYEKDFDIRTNSIEPYPEHKKDYICLGTK